MLSYQHQESRQTLAEGLSEYFDQNGKHFSTRKMTPEAQEFFNCHDVAHVVFGCGINLDDELVVKISSVFGTTAGLGVMQGYKLAESKEVYEDLRTVEIFITVLRSVFLVPQTIWRCAHMNKRWRWQEYDNFLQAPLQDLRAEFGIRVVH